jgi:hypothetical protein
MERDGGSNLKSFLQAGVILIAVNVVGTSGRQHSLEMILRFAILP